MEPEETTPLRQQLLDLSDEGKIKQKKAAIMKASEETLERILREYELKQLDEANCQLADMLIKKFAELLKILDTVKDAPALERDLASNDLLRNDVKNVVGHITPYIPLIGLLSGGLTVGKHVVEKMAEDNTDEGGDDEAFKEEPTA